jgi:hypothetical protein
VGHVLQQYLAVIDDPQSRTIDEHNGGGPASDNEEVALPHGIGVPDLLDGAIPTNYAHLTENVLDKSTGRWHWAER